MGKDDDFARFVIAVRPGLRRAAYMLCHDWHMADDLVQDTLVAVLRHWSHLKWPAKARGYAHKTLYRVYIDDYRLMYRRREVRCADPPDVSVAAPADRGIDRLVLSTVLRRLPPRQRAVLMLRFFSDLDVADTAKILRCAPSTVRSQTARALDTVRTHLLAH